MGSCFCSGAEGRYAPIEGEALGVAWALNKTRHYVMGCPALYVGVNHKPLLGLYSPKKALVDIANSRLCNLVEKATRFRFDAFHVKGKENLTPNALSHFPTEALEVGIVGKTIAKDNCAVGWMVLAGWDFDPRTREEDFKSEDLEEETVQTCKGTELF